MHSKIYVEFGNNNFRKCPDFCFNPYLLSHAPSTSILLHINPVYSSQNSTFDLDWKWAHHRSGWLVKSVESTFSGRTADRSCILFSVLMLLRFFGFCCCKSRTFSYRPFGSEKLAVNSLSTDSVCCSFDWDRARWPCRPMKLRFRVGRSGIWRIRWKWKLFVRN